MIDLKQIKQGLKDNWIAEKYANKTVFRIGVFAILILMGISIYLNGLGSHIYVNCQDKNITPHQGYSTDLGEIVNGQLIKTKKQIQSEIKNGSFEYNLNVRQGNFCLNPLYVCDIGESPNIDFCLPEYINKEHEELCKKGYCKKNMLPGETIGNKPSYLTQNIRVFIFSILLFTFLLNHLLYEKRKKEDKDVS